MWGGSDSRVTGEQSARLWTPDLLFLLHNEDEKHEEVKYGRVRETAVAYRFQRFFFFLEAIDSYACILSCTAIVYPDICG